RMLKNLYAASVAPAATKVASTAWKTIVASPTQVDTILEKAPTNTPSTAAYASTSAGLITFLNELTIARTKPTMAPPMANIQAFCTAEASTPPAVHRSPIKNQVTAAASTTVPSVMAVFSTTVSSVMRPRGAAVARPDDCPPAPPDRSILHCDGSAYCVVARPLNSALFAKTGLLLLMLPPGSLAPRAGGGGVGVSTDRKSTRLNSSHVKISYAVFCLKKKIKS